MLGRSLSALFCAVSALGRSPLRGIPGPSPLTVVIWTFGEMFYFPGMAAYLTDIAPLERRGEYMGLSQMVMGLAFAIGPWAGTTVLAHFGGRTLWLGTLALGLLAAALMGRLPQPSSARVEGLVPAPTTAPSTEP